MKGRLLTLFLGLLVPLHFLAEAQAKTGVTASSLQQQSPPPTLQLATGFRQDLVIADYLISEKLDGVRGHWTGTQMLTRSGRLVTLPQWFTRDWPDTALDGELWIGRNQFETVSALVRTLSPDEERWRQVRFMVFDLPQSPLPFAERYQALQRMLEGKPWIGVIEQFSVESHEALFKELDRRVKTGAEGLMLHHKEALYQSGRQRDLVKLKPIYDAEAVVVAHLPGKGKYRGKLGALQVRMADGREFKIGSGFSDAQRAQPPAVGSVITFQYRGLTVNGLPRFATFYRVRQAH